MGLSFDLPVYQLAINDDFIAMSEFSIKFLKISYKLIKNRTFNFGLFEHNFYQVYKHFMN